jgi:hypothetical protein
VAAQTQEEVQAMDERTDWRSSWKAIRVILCGAAFVVSAAGCANVPAMRPVTVDQVIAMSRSGSDASTIIARMQDAGGVYRLSGSQLAALKADGVPDPVLDYMQQTYLRAERERQILEGCLLGPPYFPVN